MPDGFFDFGVGDDVIVVIRGDPGWTAVVDLGCPELGEGETTRVVGCRSACGLVVRRVFDVDLDRRLSLRLPVVSRGVAGFFAGAEGLLGDACGGR